MELFEVGGGGEGGEGGEGGGGGTQTAAAATAKRNKLPSSFAEENESELEEGDGHVVRCLVRLPFEVWKEDGEGQEEEEEEEEEESDEEMMVEEAAATAS